MSDEWIGGKGDRRRNPNDKAYRDNWEKIFGEKKKPVKVKERRRTPKHGSTQIHVDKTKYNRKKKVNYETD